MEVLNRHVVSADAVEALKITVMDRKGAGGDNHQYRVEGFDIQTNPSYSDRVHYDELKELNVFFQHGNPSEGQNGVTLEALLAICEHRLLGAEEGPHACDENVQALLGISHALNSLHRRTIRLAAEKALTEK